MTTTYTYISMLRGINVSGQKKIRMTELKSVYESLDLDSAVTYLQSGNVIFDCPEQSIAEQGGAELTSIIEAGIKQFFGYSVSVFVRSRNDFHQVIENSPFTNQGNVDPTKLHVTFLSDEPSESALSRIPTCAPDEFVVRHKEVYLFCPHGYGRTKLSNNFFEKKLGVSATTRNWKTVNALYEIAEKR